MPRGRSTLHALRITGTAAILCGMAALLASGCARSAKDADVLATVGGRKITRADVAARAGVPFDSLAAPDRWTALQDVVSQVLVEREGERRDLSRDPNIKATLDAVRSDLYRARLLADMPAEPPSDSAVQVYYDTHQREFLRSVDSYLIELFWGEDQGLVNRFRSRLQEGDTSQLVTGEVVAEGRWLTEAGELDADFERELSSLEPGEVTFPRPYEDGYRIARLLEVYPAGTVLDLPAVGEEIRGRLTLEQSRRRQEALFEALRARYPVKVMYADTTAPAAPNLALPPPSPPSPDTTGAAKP